MAPKFLPNIISISFTSRSSEGWLAAIIEAQGGYTNYQNTLSSIFCNFILHWCILFMSWRYTYFQDSIFLRRNYLEISSHDLLFGSCFQSMFHFLIHVFDSCFLFIFLIYVMFNSYNSICLMLCSICIHISFYQHILWNMAIYMTPCTPRIYLGGHLILAPRFHITLPSIFTAIWFRGLGIVSAPTSRPEALVSP